jgi:hypothetical protein
VLTQEEVKKALIVVRTYPTPARTGVEVSCTAAITDKGEWLRLFPVPWRLLGTDQRFRKYYWVELTQLPHFWLLILAKDSGRVHEVASFQPGFAKMAEIVTNYYAYHIDIVRQMSYV